MRRLLFSQSVIVVKTVQPVHPIRNIWDAVTLKQQLRHHLATVQRVAGRLRQHDGMFNTALKSIEKDIQAIGKYNNISFDLLHIVIENVFIFI